MTKYEWESELKKNIHRLPDDEIRRVLEYYDELFADKIEQGGRETEIVAQFGNPVDVADKILADYDGELREANVPPPYSSEGTPQTNDAPRSPYAPVPPQNTPVRPQNTTGAPVQSVQPAPQAQRNLHGGRLAFVIVFHALTGCATVVLAAAAWIVAVALAAAGGAMFLGGAVGTIMSLFTLAQSVGAGVAQIGVAIAMCGVGILLVVGMVVAIIGLVKLTKKFFVWLANWISPKEVPHA